MLVVVSWWCHGTCAHFWTLQGLDFTNERIYIYINYCFIITLFLLKILLVFCNPRVKVGDSYPLCVKICLDVPVLSFGLLLLLLNRSFNYWFVLFQKKLQGFGGLGQKLFKWYVKDGFVV